VVPPISVVGYIKLNSIILAYRVNSRFTRVLKALPSGRIGPAYKYIIPLICVKVKHYGYAGFPDTQQGAWSIHHIAPNSGATKAVAKAAYQNVK